MNLLNARAIALGSAMLLVGCAPMVKVEPVERLAEQALVVGDPFVYQTIGEPFDVAEPLPGSLSVDDALRLALKHNAQIQSALARVRQAEADARQTRLLPNPVLGVAFRLPSGGGKSIIDADLSAELLSLITRPGRISAVDNRLRKASSEALTTVLDVAVEVERQYANAQALDARAMIGDARRSILQRLLDITNARLRAGETARLDVLTARSELSGLDGELVALRAEQRLTRITLARLIGRPSAKADWTLTPWSVTPEPSLSEADWITLALEHRPEIDAIRWELAALGQEVRIAHREVLINGSGGVASERDDVWSVGPAISLPLPIFDTGAVAKQRRTDQLIERRHELTQTGRVVIEEVRRSLETLSAARAGLDRVQGELLPLQEQRLKQAQDAYRAGLTDILAMRLAEQDLQQARARVIDLQQQVSQARSERDRAVGGSGVYLKASTAGTTPPNIQTTE
jgi:outer membrane protein, heavy metal efflux system